MNPVGLENKSAFGEDHPDVEANLKLSCGDGIIEIAATDRPHPVIGLRGDRPWRQAARNAAEDFDRLYQEASSDFTYRQMISVVPSWANTPWNLYFGIPSKWNMSEATHYTTQYLLIFLRRWQEQASSGRVESERYTYA